MLFAKVITTAANALSVNILLSGAGNESANNKALPISLKLSIQCVTVVMLRKYQ